MGLYIMVNEKGLRKVLNQRITRRKCIVLLGREHAEAILDEDSPRTASPESTLSSKRLFL